MKPIKATNLIIREDEIAAIKEKSTQFKMGFYHGYATCKCQAVEEGYHKHPKEELNHAQ